MKAVASLLITALVLAAVAALSACGASDLSARIGHTVAAGAGSKLVMSDLTDFDWQKLYIFAPYTSREQIDEALGFGLSERQGIDYREDISLLVFVEDGNVVECLAHPRSKGDFADLDGGSPWAPTTASFVVAIDGQATNGQPWLVLRPTR